MIFTHTINKDDMGDVVKFVELFLLAPELFNIVNYVPYFPQKGMWT